MKNKSNRIHGRRLLKYILKSNKILWEYSKSFLIISILANIVFGIMPTFTMLLMQLIINSIQIRTINFNQIIYLMIIYIFAEIIQSLLSVAYGHYNLKHTLLFTKNIDSVMLNKCITLDLKDFEDGNVHDTISRARSEGPSKLMSFFTITISAFKSTITVITMLGVAISYSYLVIPLVLIVPIIKSIYSFKFNYKKFNIIKNRTGRERINWYINHLFFTGSAYKEIKLYNLQDYFISKYNKFRELSIAEDVNLSRKASIILIMISILDEIINGSVTISILYQGFIGTILIGDIVTYIRSITNVKSNIESIFSSINNLTKQALFVSQYFDFMDIESPKDGDINITHVESIHVKDLSFKYPNATDYTLRNISLSLKKGDTLLLMGENGSGKSTLIKILLGYYLDYDGSVLINGCELKSLNIEHYHKHISSIFQDFIRYEATVRDNISYGNLEIANDDQELNKLLNESGLGKKKISLDDLLGSWFAGAKQLSGGEWQKIAIARALAKNSDLYFLDEPDSSIDAISEKEIITQYQRLFLNKICVISSHRFSNLCLSSNKIIVLDNGRIIEQGSHKELMELKGKYFEMFTGSSCVL